MDYYVKTEKLEMQIEEEKRVEADQSDIRFRTYSELLRASSDENKDK